MNTPTVSIVVASHRASLVPDLLNALSADVTGAIPFETIVVADYPTGQFHSDYPTVKWLFLNLKSISAKRNVGIRESQAPIVAFIDDDCKPGRGWLELGLSYLACNPEVAGVEGETLIEKLAGQDTRREYLRLQHQGFRTNNVFYRKRVLTEVGMFDERFTVQREDLDLAFSILDKGYTIGYDEAIQVEHRYRHWEKWDLLKNCMNRRFDPLLFRKHPRRYREHVGSPFPPGLALLLLAHLAVLLSPWLRGPLRAVPLALDAIATGAYAARRTSRSFSVPGIREIAAAIAAPAVLLGALVYGSIRYRKFLIV